MRRGRWVLVGGALGCVVAAFVASRKSGGTRKEDKPTAGASDEGTPRQASEPTPAVARDGGPVLDRARADRIRAAIHGAMNAQGTPEVPEQRGNGDFPV